MIAFAVSVFAVNPSRGTAHQALFLARGLSEEEVVGKAYGKIRSEFPSLEGWRAPEILVSEIPSWWLREGDEEDEGECTT